MESLILKQQQHVYGSFCYVSRVLITLSGSMQAQRLTSGAVGWSCTPCCAALCPLMTSTSPLCLRRSEEASSTSPSTWPALWPRCSCSCCRWTLSREPPSKTSGAHHALLGSSGPNRGLVYLFWSWRQRLLSLFYCWPCNFKGLPSQVSLQNKLLCSATAWLHASLNVTLWHFETTHH